MSFLTPADPRVARVEQADGSKPPILTQGKVTPRVFRDFVDAAEHYHYYKKIADENKVQSVVYGLKDARIKDWYGAKKAELNASTWEDFLPKLAKVSLPGGWERETRNQILSARQGNETFEDFYIRISALNSLISDTDSHVTLDYIRMQLSSNCHPDLHHLCEEALAHEIVDFTDFLDVVTKLDEKRIRAAAQHKALVEQVVKERSDRVAKAAPFTIKNRVTPGGTSKTVVTAYGPPMPPLLEEERALLGKHDGCYKCRRFYAGHRANACTNDYPDATTYKTLTKADAEKAKARVALPAGKKTVAAVNVIAAVGMSSSVIDEAGDETVSDIGRCAPFHVPHLYWDCLLDSPGAPSYIETSALIDDGCTAVLIRPELADQLKLRRFRLHKPVEVGLAMESGEANVKFELKEWVRLRFISPNHSWCSRSVKAIVTPGLCAPVILGQSFLSANTIVIDYSDRSVVDKSSGFNLLNADANTVSTPTPGPSRKSLPKVGTVKNARRAVLKELGEVLPEHKHLAELNNECSPSVFANVTYVAAVRRRIETLAFAEKLKRRDSKFKERYGDVFGEIPHTDDLPTDVYHRVKLKDPLQVIACRGYACPRKHREAWDQLIKSHLDAGRIRPSNSPYASPAFLVPKADKDALPRHLML